MNVASSQMSEGVIVRRSLGAEWNTHFLSSREISLNETSTLVGVEIFPGISMNIRFICPDNIRDQVEREGRVRRQFHYKAVVTDEGPAIKIDKIEIDGYPYLMHE